MEKPFTQLNISDNIATITLDRPDTHNALNASMINDLLNILSELEENKSIRVVLLTANGHNFCAGADLESIRASSASHQKNDDSMTLHLAKLMHTLYHLSKPTLVLVHGAIYGGGIGLIACCDIALAAKNSHFCFSEVRLGLIPSIISPYVIKAIGSRAARRYLLTAEQFSADQAFDLGLVHIVLEDNKFSNYTEELCQNLIAAGPNALAHTKRLINNVSQKKLDDTLMVDTVSWLNEIRETNEAKEGINAFFEKRAANWVNSDKDKLNHDIMQN